jgi:hypothetical protein
MDLSRGTSFGQRSGHADRRRRVSYPALIQGFVLALALSILPFGVSASAAARVALVMASDLYPKLGKSSLGVKRGEEIAKALEERGFDVIQSSNPSNATARARILEFAGKAESADLAVAVLLGHGTSWGSQSFFLPANTELGRATDLLSRALSITTVAQVASRAKAGAVFFLMTTPEIGADVEGLNARPQFGGAIGRNTVAVFSSSAKVPLSRVDATSEQAADALAASFRQKNATLADAVKAVLGGQNGTVVGPVPEVGLDAPPAPPTLPAPAPVAVSPPPPADIARRDDKGPDNAEWQMKVKELEAQLQTQLSKQREAEARAKEADARARQAEADAREREAAATRAALDKRSTNVQFASAQAEEKVAAPTLDEDSQLGRKQRALIQERLRYLGLYPGAIDAIMGPLTREAIMGFQKNRGAQVTGFLTADQFSVLLSTGNTQR